MGNLLLVIALGLLFVGGAATATGADDACGAGHLALASASRRVAESCSAAGTPTASCCESVIATVPCVCRVAVQHPVDHSLFLNASRIVALYSSCRGRLRLRGAGAGYLASAACLGVLEHRSFVTSVATTVHSPLMLSVSDANQQPKARGREHVEPSSCDSTPMAAQLVQHCNIGNIRPSRRCCTVVLAIIDDQHTDCLCMVVDEAEFTKSYLSVSAVWGYYRACGGRQQRPPKDTDACEHAPAPAPPPPPPPPPPPSPPRPPSRSPPKRPSNSKAASAVTAFLLGVAVVSGIVFLLSLAVLLVVKAKKSRVPAAIPVVEEQWISMPHWPQVPAPAPAPAPAPVDAEAGQVQQQAVAQPPPPPLFAPQPVVKEGEAPPVPPLIPFPFPFPPPLPLKVPTGESVPGGAV